VTWNPEQYDRFKEERSRPFYDLLALIEAAGERRTIRVVDLGCGTGDLTAVLHRELGSKETVGVDSSSKMLEKSPTGDGALRFEQGDIAAYAARRRGPSDGFDLVFSNAALHWLSDHPALFADLRAMLKPGGQLAVQMPANFDHPSHTVAAEIAREPAFAEAVAGHERHVPVLAPEAYATLLDGLGFVRQRVRLEVYTHHLASRAEVVEWVKGTLLTRYRARFDDATYDRFLARYRERLFEVLPDTKPYLYPFKRLLLWGRLPVGE
jgi:trans-aconitate 2-methyltransferase